MTPVLAAIPLDTLIWIVLLLIGAIGSIASNARKAARAPKAAPPQRTAPQTAVPPSPVPDLRAQLAAKLTDAVQQRTVAPSPAPVIIPRPRPVAARPVAEPAPVVPPPSPASHGTAGFRGMFERGSLVRAVVAAEVLGPPKSLQEQSIWSPRHSEPSI